MKIITCLLTLAVVNCRAGIESGFGIPNNGLGDHSSGYQHSAPVTEASEYSGHVQDFYSGFNSHNFETSPNLPVSHGGHDFSQNQDSHDFHDSQRGTNDFTNGHFPGGHKNDYTIAIAQVQDLSGHSHQNSDHGNNGIKHDFGIDSYLQAAHDLGSENFHSADTGHHGNTGSQGNINYQQMIHNQHQNAGDQYNQEGDHQGFILHDGDHEFGNQHTFGNSDAFSIGEHIEEEHPVEVPHYKHITVPVHRPLHISVPKPILVGIPQPYPVKVPVHKPVAVPVETEISIPIEKLVPYPVVKQIPYPVEKHVPIKVEKTVTVHVPHPYPVKIPVYKTIHHKSHY